MDKNRYLTVLLCRFLKIQGVSCHEEEVDLLLKSSPYFPSVLSIIQTCSYFGLTSKAYMADYNSLKIANSALILLKEDEEREKFVLFEKIDQDKVFIFDALNYKKIELERAVFIKLWTGIAILPKEIIVQKQNKKVEKKYLSQYATAIIAMNVGVLYDYYNNHYLTNSIFAFLLIALSIIGIYITISLIRLENNNSYSFIDNFCHSNDSFDCHKVLLSNASKLFHKVSLADIGFVYFESITLILIISLFFNTVNVFIPVILYVSLAVLPFVFFSIIYQKIIVRNWCPLCLAVMGVLVLEAILFFLYPTKTIHVMQNWMLITILISLSVFSSTQIIMSRKRSIKNSNEIKHLKTTLIRLKRNRNVIHATFGEEKEKTEMSKLTDMLVFGKKTAPIIITTLLNPSCQPCREIASNLIKLIENYPYYIQWHIRLDGIISNNFININKIQLYLIQKYHSEISNEAKIKLFKECFISIDFTKSLKYHFVSDISEETIDFFRNHLQNNEKTKTNKVPTVWINNRIFPVSYSISDIPYLIPDIDFLEKLLN